MKVLVVEDDPLIQASLRELVEAWGYACDEAGDGEVAWELLQACPYDLVLLDLHLPRLDGLALCRRLRQRGGHQPLVLMLTARFAERDIPLTATEHRLLEALLEAAGATCSKERLLQACWNWSDAPVADSLKTHIKNLRAKLSVAGAPPDLVETVYGVGFRLHPDHAA